MKTLSIILTIIAIFACFNQAIGCSVWTDKSEYAYGEIVHFYFSTDVDCHGKLTVTSPEGSGTIFSGDVIAGKTYEKTGQAWGSCGLRTVKFKVTCNNNGGGSEHIIPYFSGDSSDSSSCSDKCTFNVRCEPIANCNDELCQSQDGFIGQPYERDGWIYQKYKDCGCNNGECICFEIGKKLHPVQTCDALACQNQNGPSGQPYYRNDEMYQDHKICDCVDGSCECEIISNKVPCSGSICVQVKDDQTGSLIAGASVSAQCGEIRRSGTTDSNGACCLQGFCPNKDVLISCYAQGYLSNSQSLTADSGGNGRITLPLSISPPVCSGAISGYIYDDKTREPISGASLLVCQDGSCWSPQPSDSIGYYKADQECYASKYVEITCSAENYETATQSASTDEIGKANLNFYLEPKNKCPGIISGSVYDSTNNTPIAGASILICQNDRCWSPPATNENGVFLTGKESCPLARTEITCSAENYETANRTITTDVNGNADLKDDAQYRINLKPKSPKCPGIIEGRLYSAKTNESISGASILICQNGNCWSPSPSDGSGHYSSGKQLCPSASVELTCSADGYKPASRTLTTDSSGYDSVDLGLEAELSLEAKVSTDKKEYSMGEEIVIHYETNIADAAKMISVISEGTETPAFAHTFGENNFSRELAGTKKLTINKPGTFKVKLKVWTDKQRNESECEFTVAEKDLVLKVWTDKTEYKSGEEVAVHYEINNEDAARRITVIYKADSSAFNEEFGENSFSHDMSGTRNVTANNPGAYRVKLEGWTGKQSKNAECEFDVIEKDLALKVWTDKAEYKPDEEIITIHYETGVEDAARRIIVTEQGTHTQPFSKTFNENYFFNETKGTRSLTLNKSATYEVKLEAWTGRESKEARCKFTVLEKDLALKIWTNKTDYNAGEEVIIYYETGVESAARRIIITSSGSQAPSFSKAFEENTFSKEKSGSRKITLDQPGPYEIKLEAWTENEKTDAKCSVSVCGGIVSGRALNSLTGKPVQGATITICAKGICYRPIISDSSGQYSLSGFCPSVDYELTCAANGFQSYKSSNRTDENGDSSQNILLEPICNGQIAGKVLNSLTKKTVRGAPITICAGGKCSDQIEADSSGQYRQKGCPSTDYKISCSADGYKVYKNTSRTDEKGNCNHDILLELDCAGTISGRVIDSMSKEAIQGSTIVFCINKKCSDSVTSDSVGQFSRDECCPSVEYKVNCSASGYRSFEGSILTDDKGGSIYNISLDRALSLKVWTDKPEYEKSDEVIINYETGTDGAARRITVSSPGMPATTFGENAFEKGSSGTKKITPDKSGAYEVKLEAWTAKERKEAKCQFKVVDKPLALRIWTDKTNYRAGEEVALHYETGVEEAARRITVSSEGAIVATFGENTFQKETNGNRTLTLEKPGSYEAKLEAWTSTQRKETTCKFNLGDNEKPDILIFNSNLTSPQKPGIIINFMALATDPESDELQYKFWLKGPSTGGKWKAETDWVKKTTILFSKHSWIWLPTPQDNGKNEVSVWVRDDKHAGPDGFDAANNLSFEIMEGNILPNIISVSFAPGSPASLGLINVLGFVFVKVQAEDQENDSLQYRFELKEPGGDFKVAANWQSSPLWSWQPNKAGEYEIRAMATDGRAEAEKVVKYTIVNKPPVVELELSPPGPAEAGAEIKCKATATDIDGDAIQYKFWLNGPATAYQWEAQTDWVSEEANGFSSEYTWSWKTSQADIGKNAIRVWIRDGNHAGPDGFDAFNATSIDITKEREIAEGKKLEIISFRPMFPSPQDMKTSPIMWTTKVSKPDDSKVEYQFEESRGGSEFRVIKPYSSSSLFIWTPTDAGNYRVKATVRNGKGEVDSKIEEYTITDSSDSKPQELTLIIRNAGGHKMPACGGTLSVYALDSKLKTEQVNTTLEYESESSEATLKMKDFSAESLDVAVFQTPSNSVTEYWGHMMVGCQGSQGEALFTRNMPWIENISSEGVITIRNDAEISQMVRVEFEFSPDKRVIEYVENYPYLIIVPAKGSQVLNFPLLDDLIGDNLIKVGDALYIKVSIYTISSPALESKGRNVDLVDQWEWILNQQLINKYNHRFLKMARGASDRSKANMDIANKIRMAAGMNEISRNYKDLDNTLNERERTYIYDKGLDKKDAEITLLNDCINDFKQYVDKQIVSWKKSGLMELLAEGEIISGGLPNKAPDISVAKGFEKLSDKQKEEAEKWLIADLDIIKAQLDAELSNANDIEKNLNYALEIGKYSECEDTRKIRETCRENREIIEKILTEFWS